MEFCNFVIAGFGIMCGICLFYWILGFIKHLIIGFKKRAIKDLKD